MAIILSLKPEEQGIDAMGAAGRWVVAEDGWVKFVTGNSDPLESVGYAAQGGRKRAAVIATRIRDRRAGEQTVGRSPFPYQGARTDE